jgi:hypothetical protein
VAVSSLTAALIRECAACPHVAVAWVSPLSTACTIEAARTLRTRTHKAWKEMEVVYCDPMQWRDVSAVAARIRKAFPDVDVSVVSYAFHPGGGWKAVYRRDGAAPVDSARKRR